jgi:hypothetical protein
MDLAPLKAKTDSIPKSVDPPKQIIEQNLRPAVLTLKEPAARGWLPKFALASALLFALGWSGMHLDIGKRFMDLWHGTSAAEKGSFAPMAPPTPESLDPAAPADSGNFSPGPSSNAPTEDENPGPQRGGVQSTISSREPN